MNERLIANRLSEFPKGWSAKVRPIRPYANVSLGQTALHEARHLVLLVANGTGAKSGTVEPGDGYLGMIEPHGFDAIAALGPHSVGDPGTRWDVEVARRGGADIQASASIARSMLSRLKEEVHLVAGLLETKRTVSGFEVEEVMKKNQDPDEEVEVTDPIGNITNLKTTRSKRHWLVLDIKEKNKVLEFDRKKKAQKARPFSSKINSTLKIAA